MKGGRDMSGEKKKPAGTISGREESYRLAKLLRAGNRELARQLNIKRSRKQR